VRLSTLFLAVLHLEETVETPQSLLQTLPLALLPHHRMAALSRQQAPHFPLGSEQPRMLRQQVAEIRLPFLAVAAMLQLRLQRLYQKLCLDSRDIETGSFRYLWQPY
jgi:hypothetical protein